MKLIDKINNDVDELKQELREQGIDSVFQHVYDLAFYYQVAWYFGDIDDEDIADFDILLNYEGNIPRDIFQRFEEYSSSGYCNNTCERINDIVHTLIEELNWDIHSFLDLKELEVKK